MNVPENKVVSEGVEIAYWVMGEGPPIVLLTGLATPAASWSVLPKLLADQGYKVLVVENRDCGKSSPCDGLTYTIADMADDVTVVMNAAGIESAYVFGISMGGMIAQELALNHPDRVIRLMLVATSHGGSEATVPPAEKLTALLTPTLSIDLVDAMSSLLGRLMGPGFADRNPNLIREIAETRVQLGSNPASFARQWEAILGFDTFDRLGDLEMPVMVVHGESDPLVPFQNAKKIVSLIPDAELVALPGVGHFVPLEAPAEVLGAITSFFPADVLLPAEEKA